MSGALAVRRLDTPVGEVWITASETALISVGWTEPEKGVIASAVRREAIQPCDMLDCFGCKPPRNDVSCNQSAQRASLIIDRAEQQLREYFSSTRRHFDLPLSDEKGTPFQRLVWGALRQIPYGETRTYGQIAAQIGRPKAARAVGGACNRNPLAIVVPCHRVVSSTGALTGFAGGIDNKKALLGLERGVFY